MRAALGLSLLALALAATPASAWATTYQGAPQPDSWRTAEVTDDLRDTVAPLPVAGPAWAFAEAQVGTARDTASTVVAFAFVLEEHACYVLSRGPAVAVACLAEPVAGTVRDVDAFVAVANATLTEAQADLEREAGRFDEMPERLANEAVASANEGLGAALQCAETCVPAEAAVVAAIDDALRAAEQVAEQVPRLPDAPEDPAAEPQALVAEHVAAGSEAVQEQVPACTGSCVPGHDLLVENLELVHAAAADLVEDAGETFGDDVEAAPAAVLLLVERNAGTADAVVALWQGSLEAAVEAALRDGALADLEPVVVVLQEVARALAEKLAELAAEEAGPAGEDLGSLLLGPAPAVPGTEDVTGPLLQEVGTLGVDEPTVLQPVVVAALGTVDDFQVFLQTWMPAL